MLRLLLESNTRGFQFRQGALVSLVAHSVLITASVFATREGPAKLIETAQENVQFLRVGEKAGTAGYEEKIVDRLASRQAPVVGKGKEEGKPEEAAADI